MDRFSVTASGGTRGGKSFAVIDRQDKQGGKGMRRMSFHKTFAQARDEAKRLNALFRREGMDFEGGQ